MNEDVLTFIRDKWTSSNPRDRAIGWVGKLVVEGGLFLLAATAIALCVFLVFRIAMTSIQPLDAALTVWMSALGLFFSKSFCSIITDD